MSDFQVGDRVSVEGVVTKEPGKDGHAFILSDAAELYRIWYEDLTLVERPKRELRVGSVWERWGVLYCVGTDEDGYKHLVSLKDGGILDASLIGVSHPECWREVPVEELEREAGR